MPLNPQQLSAVQHKEGPLLILAGAGTGKTRVLTHRIAYLVKECGLSPGRILAVTFTNKAAGEMKKRVEQLVGPRARELWVGTFHSTCAKILRKHALEAGLSPQFIIYDQADQHSVVKQTLKELNLDEKRLPLAGLVSKISRLKDQLTTVADLETRADNPFTKTLAKVYALYEKILSANHAVDFGDLIAKTVYLLQEKSPLLKGYQGLWRQILIDEYQDTNHAQYRLVSLLADAHKNICVVGDPDQSIYRWRGADLHNILNFEKDYPQAKVVRLEQNYRSVRNVLKGASALIANNEIRKEKNLWSAREEGEKIGVTSLASDKEEARFVVERFQRLHREERISYAEMAVFYRTNAQSRAMEEMLRMAGIPYRIYGGLSFYERAEVKDVLAYLRIFLEPKDSVSFKRIINVPARGIGKTTIEKIEEVALSRNLSFYEAAKLTEVHPRLKTFLDWFENLRAGRAGLSLLELLQKILETSGYVVSLSRQATSEAQERMANLNELVASVAEFEERNSGSGLGDYLEQIALITDLDQKTETGVLSLMTLHLAKGLEFRCVAVVGLEEGLLPHARSQDELEELEEERRLFYVGMTRAKERLLLTHAWRRFINGREQYGLPSRFLGEIPSELTARVDVSGKRENDFDQSTEYKEEYEPTANYPIGSRVKHPDFGVGYVAATEKTTLGEKVTVKFGNGAIKKLIAEYAHLERI